MRPFTDAQHDAVVSRVRALAANLPRRGKAPGDPRAVARVLAEAGLFRLCAPQAYGGAAPSVEPLALVTAREELARHEGTADAIFAVQGLGAHPIAAAGNDAERARWLPPLARGEALAAFAVTEPEAGSDLAAISCSARRDGDGYVLDGHKVFISNAAIADVLVVLARADGGPTMFAVPARSAGIDVTPIEMLASHPVAAVRLRDLRVPEASRLGAEGSGLALCLATLELFRSTVGAAACGLASRALDETRRRVLARRQFGRPLAEHQSVQFALAEMATGLEAARLLVYRAAWLKQHTPGRHDREASMAKLFATETAQRIVDQAVQLHGAAGLVRGAVVESLYREVRALRIYEGTSEMQKLVIARDLLGG